MVTPPDLLTVQEFADLIRVHPRTIYRRIWADRQPGVHRFGRDIRIDLASALEPAVEPLKPPSSHAPALGRLFTGV